MAYNIQTELEINIWTNVENDLQGVGPAEVGPALIPSSASGTNGPLWAASA